VAPAPWGTGGGAAGAAGAERRAPAAWAPLGADRSARAAAREAAVGMARPPVAGAAPPIATRQRMCRWEASAQRKAPIAPPIRPDADTTTVILRTASRAPALVPPR